MVKSNYKPAISKKKQLEMQLLKENLANPARKRFRAGTRASYSHRSKSPVGDGPEDAAHTEAERTSRIKKRKIIWKDNPMRPKTPPRREFKKYDYLKEAQLKKQEEIQDGDMPEQKQSLEQTWKKDLVPDLSQQEKYELIKD